MVPFLRVLRGLGALGLASCVAPRHAGELSACSRESSGGECIEGGFAVQEGLAEAAAEDEETERALQLLQRRGIAQMQMQQQPLNLPTASPYNRPHINMNSSRHGHGSVWRHWRRLLKQCSRSEIDIECRQAIAETAMSVFRLIKRKEGHNYTANELVHFRKRFVGLLKANTTLVMSVQSLTHQYTAWKQAVFQIYSLTRPAVTEQLVEFVNRGRLGWTAEYRADMAQQSTLTAMQMTGLEISQKESEVLLQETLRSETEDLLQVSNTQEWVTQFDARERWPECRSITGHVRFQDCQNCWSHSTALIAESRICIATGGRLKGRDAWLSQSFIAMCRPDGRDYCAGGPGSLGFLTVNKYGVPTGAPNDKGNAQPGIHTCVPQIQPNLQGVICPSECGNGYPRSMEHDLFFPKFNPKPLSPKGAMTFTLVRRSMLEEGPVLFGMTVYADFWSYVSGIYKPSDIPSNRNMGGHAVTGMGFGPGYFLCINSWGPTFGDRGGFKVTPEALNLVVVLPGHVYDSSYPMPVP